MADQHGERDVVRLGVDFGVSTTVIAAHGAGPECHTVEFPGISHEFPASPDCISVHSIPSIIRYEGGQVIWSGDEVLRGSTADDPATARWLRRYLCDQSPVQIPAGDGVMGR